MMILLVRNRPQRSPPHKVRHLSPTRQVLDGSRIRETSQKRKAQRVRVHFKGSEVLLPKCSRLIRTCKGKRGFASAGVSEPITRPRCAEYAPIRKRTRAGKTPTLKSYSNLSFGKWMGRILVPSQELRRFWKECGEEPRRLLRQPPRVRLQVSSLSPATDDPLLAFSEFDAAGPS